MKLLNFMTFQVFYVPYEPCLNGFSRDNRVEEGGFEFKTFRKSM